MGFCESLLRKNKNENPINNPNSDINVNTLTKQYKEKITQDDLKKSNDTMEYKIISLNDSFNIETRNKKQDNNSTDEKEKTTNDTNNNQEKIKLKKYLGSSDINPIQNSDIKSEESSFKQEEITPQKNPLMNSDYINKLNQNMVDNNQITKQKNSQISNSFGKLTNTVPSMNYGYNNQISPLNTSSRHNNNTINVSLHGSHMSQSAYLNIPKPDKQPIYLSNNFSNSLFQSQ